METEDYKIHIVGSGVSGLVAAQILEKNGFRPIVIESTDRAGGRVKTDKVNGYQLDHGFQVLLTAYPEAQKDLDFEALALQKVLPGASVFRDKSQKIIGDPLRDKSLLLPTLFSGIGNLSDKIKILKLNKLLKGKSLAAIFDEKEKTTLAYLKDFGFSNEIISDFFRPFFSGIFLESTLETSSRMFEFVYKMFGEGDAAIPKLGIEAIPRQLVQKLTNTVFKFNTKVKSIKDGEIVLDDGDVLKSHFTIIATDVGELLSNLKDQEIPWKSCETFYFETEHKEIKKPLIGLIPEKKALINNIFYHTSISSDTSSVKKGSKADQKELLSVTVIDNQGLTAAELLEQVKKELYDYCGIRGCNLIKHYSIPKALPNLSNLRYEMEPSETRLTTSIFLAGDTQLNGSLNAAMIAGERAALGLILTLSSTAY